MKTQNMTVVEINDALGRFEQKLSKLCDEFIDAGRGHEKPSETWELRDPLAMRWQLATKRHRELRAEVEARYGPGAPSRLPRGFGPRRAT